MGLITQTNQAYYNQSQGFTGNGSTVAFTLTTSFFPTLPSSVKVFVDGKEIYSAKDLRVGLFEDPQNF